MFSTKKEDNKIKIEIKENDLVSFKNEISIIKSEFEKMLSDSLIINDIKYLRKIAIYIKQIQYNAKRLSLHPKLRRKAKAIERFLETPLIHPFTEKMSLAEAAISFSVQDPGHSDLREILREILGQAKPEFLHLFELSRTKNSIRES